MMLKVLPKLFLLLPKSILQGKYQLLLKLFLLLPKSIFQGEY